MMDVVSEAEVMAELLVSLTAVRVAVLEMTSTPSVAVDSILSETVRVAEDLGPRVSSSQIPSA